MGACRSVEGNLGPSNREDPKNPLLVCYRVKYLKLEFFVTITMLGKYLYTPLYEQYYFNNYGAYLLKNTSFLFPNHSFCVSSDMINLYLSDNNSYKLDETYSSDLVAYGEIVNRFPAILTTLILGPLTDRLGRRIGLFFPTLGITLQGILSIIIIYFDLNPYYFILANFVGGIFGNTAAILASAFSYIADTSSPRWRSLRIGAVESALAFGEGFGQFLGGYWLQSINCNFIPPMVLYIGCNIFLMVYIIFIPESLTTTERKEIVKKNPKGIKAYMEGLRIFSGRLSLSSTWKLYATFISVNILLFNILGAKLISVYFLKAIPFSFNALQIGFYQSIKSISQGISILIFVGILTILSKSDAWIMFVSAVVNVTCNILTGFSRKAWQVYAVVLVQGVEGIGATGARSLMSKLVTPEQQGALFSVIASVESAFALLSSVFWPLIYPLTLKYNMMSGMIYIFMAAFGFIILPLVLSHFLFKNDPAKKASNIASEGSEEYSSLLTNKSN